MKKNIFLFSIVSVILFATTMYCESPVIFTQGAKDRAMAIENGEFNAKIINKTRKEGQSAQVDLDMLNRDASLDNMADYPSEIGAINNRVVYLGQKVPFTKVIETAYQFISDQYGNVGIAYVDESTNAILNAVGGFYVVQKQNAQSGELEWAKYCVDNSGYILFGWIIESDGTRYYLSEKQGTIGEVVKGAVRFSNGRLYYFDGDGILQYIQE